MTRTMKAVIAARPGGPDVLTLVDRPSRRRETAKC